MDDDAAATATSSAAVEEGERVYFLVVVCPVGLIDGCFDNDDENDINFAGSCGDVCFLLAVVVLAVGVGLVVAEISLACFIFVAATAASIFSFFVFLPPLTASPLGFFISLMMLILSEEEGGG